MSSSFTSFIKRIPGTLCYRYEDIELGHMISRTHEYCPDSQKKISTIYTFDKCSIQITGTTVYFMKENKHNIINC